MRRLFSYERGINAGAAAASLPPLVSSRSRLPTCHGAILRAGEAQQATGSSGTGVVGWRNLFLRCGKIKVCSLKS